MSRLFKGLAAGATLAYPLAVYFGLGRFNPVWLALLLAGLMAVRAWAGRDPVWWFAAAGALLLALASLFGGSWLPLKLYPVMVSAVLLLVFGASLLRPPSVIERIARLSDPHLAPEGVAYTRKVTLVWYVFFAVNGTLALATVLWGSDELWLFYNGLLAYVLMGGLFAAEWLVRQRLKTRMAAAGARG